MDNIKDTMTTIAGYLGAFAFVSATIVGSLIQSGIVIPLFVTALIGACGAASVAILGWYNGKNPDGSKKTVAQITEQNAKAEATR
jgi:hypothetical protein